MAIWRLDTAITAFTTLSYLLFILQSTSAEQCNRTDTRDSCGDSNTITIDGQDIYKGELYVKVMLTSLSTEETWLCGDVTERVLSWSGNANTILVAYHTDGRIVWTVCISVGEVSAQPRTRTPFIL